MNRWGIPKGLEEEIVTRDKTCVYCGVLLLEKAPRNGSRKHMATWEHIINDARIVTRENIARCCAACNSSKGTKLLADWIQSDYCKKKALTSARLPQLLRKSCRVNNLSNLKHFLSSWPSPAFQLN